LITGAAASGKKSLAMAIARSVSGVVRQPPEQQAQQSSPLLVVDFAELAELVSLHGETSFSPQMVVRNLLDRWLKKDTDVNLMDLMRRRRAQALDEMNRPIPRYEGEQALEHAEKFVAHVLRLARKSHTQLTLFR
jgi:hypothetical protein